MTDKLRRSMVTNDATIADAMRSLEQSATQIVLVVDREQRLCGTVSDGDLRRALLAGDTLASPVAPRMNRKFFTAGPDDGRAEVLELMQARSVSQVPVVNSDSRLVGLHLLHALLGGVSRPNAAVVMAGGMGSRLGSLTNAIPKPMLPVAGRPILERIVLHLVSNGIRHVYLSVNYLAEVIEKHFSDGHRFGCRIDYLREEVPLGTGGALSLLPCPPEVPLLVMNGDLVTQAQVGRIIDDHEAGEQIVTMAVRRHYHRVPYGCVQVDGRDLIAFEEKPTSVHLINAGIYVLSPDALELVAPQDSMSMPALVQRLHARGRRIRVFELNDDWIDVGVPEELARARGNL